MKYRRLYTGARTYDILCDRDRSRCRALGGARSGSPQLYNMSGVIMGVKKNRLSGNHNSHHTTIIREAVIEVE